MRRIRAFEHSRLDIGSALTAGEAAELMTVHDALPANGRLRALERGHNCLFVRGHVGTIAADSVTLDILPKIARDDGPMLQGVLVRMIAATLGLELHEGAARETAFQSHTLLDVFIALFARRVESEAARGWARSYSRRRADLPKLRGKLDLGRQFSALAGRTDVLSCRYDEFTADTPLNRVLRAAIRAVQPVTQDYRTRQRLTALDAQMGEVADVPPLTAAALPVTLDRRTRRWEPALRLARLLLEARSQTVHGRGGRGITFLFNMHQLFERYLAVECRRLFEAEGWQVSASGHSRWFDTTRSLRLRPDILLRRAGRTVVVDAKWKTPGERTVAHGDAYQMFAYARAFQSQEVVPVYPLRQASDAGRQVVWELPDGVKLRAVWLDLADERAFRRGLETLVVTHAARLASASG